MTTPQHKDTTLDEILSNLGASNIPDTDGKYQEVDPVSIAYVKKALLQWRDKAVVEERKKTLCIVKNRLIDGGYKPASEYITWLEGHSDYMQEIGYSVVQGADENELDAVYTEKS